MTIQNDRKRTRESIKCVFFNVTNDFKSFVHLNHQRTKSLKNTKLKIKIMFKRFDCWSLGKGKHGELMEVFMNEHLILKLVLGCCYFL